jgi:hypothetical protein
MLDKRVSLQGAFPELETPYPGTENHPYDTIYRTLRTQHIPSKDGVREFLRKSLPSWLSWSNAEIQDRPSDYSAGELPEFYSPFLDSLARFVIGTLGGCVLVIPMTIMVFQPSLSKSLVTVSVAVVLFALALSLVFKTDNMDTITATATYAAVMVVFVGTTGGAGNGAQI